MNEDVKSVLGRWVMKFHWDEVVLGTTWETGRRGLRSMWRNGYMANQKGRNIGIRLVRDSWKEER